MGSLPSQQFPPSLHFHPTIFTTGMRFIAVIVGNTKHLRTTTTNVYVRALRVQSQGQTHPRFQYTMILPFSISSSWDSPPFTGLFHQLHVQPLLMTNYSRGICRTPLYYIVNFNTGFSTITFVGLVHWREVQSLPAIGEVRMPTSLVPRPGPKLPLYCTTISLHTRLESMSSVRDV